MSTRHVLAVSLLALAACATAPKGIRHYTLSDESPQAAKAARAVPDYRVAIGPVTLPEALDRPQIVLRVAPHRYTISDTDHWADPLKREIPRVIARDVARRLPAAQVAANFQYGGQDADFLVLIDVLRLDAVPGVSVTLDAAWSVRNRAGARLREAHSVIVEPVSATGIAVLAVAHANAVAALAREIAAAVETSARAKP